MIPTLISVSLTPVSFSHGSGSAIRSRSANWSSGCSPPVGPPGWVVVDDDSSPSSDSFPQAATSSPNDSSNAAAGRMRMALMDVPLGSTCGEPPGPPFLTRVSRSTPQWCEMRGTVRRPAQATTPCAPQVGDAGPEAELGEDLVGVLTERR